MNHIRNMAFVALIAVSPVCMGQSPSPTQPVTAEPPIVADSGPTLIGGTVLSILPAGQYQYMEIDSGSGSVWIAVVQQPVSTGQHITCSSATLMENFDSKALKRKFDQVFFADGLQVDGESTDPAAAEEAPVALPEGHPDMSVCPEAAKAPAPVAAMDKPDGGVTLAELVEQQEKLAGTEVALRAQVTKVTLDIMDANWLHLRDASTDRDLVVSCKAAPSVGDVVVVKGKLERNIKIGGDHVYDLLIQSADVTTDTPSKP